MTRQPLGDPTPRAVAVVVRHHKLLVIARRLDGQEYAVLPGGGIEPGETAAEGGWLIPFQKENPRAAAFWRRLAAEGLEDVSERQLAVPDKPHLPPDVWLTGHQR